MSRDFFFLFRLKQGKRCVPHKLHMCQRNYIRLNLNKPITRPYPAIKSIDLLVLYQSCEVHSVDELFSNVLLHVKQILHKLIICIRSRRSIFLFTPLHFMSTNRALCAFLFTMTNFFKFILIAVSLFKAMSREKIKQDKRIKINGLHMGKMLRSHMEMNVCLLSDSLFLI